MAGENFIALEITSQEIKTGVDTVGNQLGGFTGNTDTVKTELETLKNNMAQLQTKVDQLLSKGGGLTSCVKSVQRGIINTSKTTTVKLNSINPNKCIVILNSEYSGISEESSSRDHYVNQSYIQSLTSTSLTISENLRYGDGDYNYGNVSYQVIEFY